MTTTPRNRRERRVIAAVLRAVQAEYLAVLALPAAVDVDHFNRGVRAAHAAVERVAAMFHVPVEAIDRMGLTDRTTPGGADR